jgi:hypothetical protein
LRDCGIEVILPEDQRTGDSRKVTIGESWLVEPEWSDDELADDAKRCAELEDADPPGWSSGAIVADLEREAAMLDNLTTLGQ